jgi:hypothetical protein
LVHRPLIPRIRVGQAFESNVHHKKVTEAADRLVDLLAQFAAGQEIDKVHYLIVITQSHPANKNLRHPVATERCILDLYSGFSSRV